MIYRNPLTRGNGNGPAFARVAHAVKNVFVGSGEELVIKKEPLLFV
jgi:hypothetical protein